MLKRFLRTSKSVIELLCILAIAVFLFAVGVQFFQPTTSFNPSIIDNNGIPLFNKFIASAGRENWLIPIGTFCSALSALATVYLILLQQQTIKKHDLEVETERVISHFFILLDKHRTIINNLKFTYIIYNQSEDKYENKYAEKYDCTNICIELIRNILYSYFYSYSVSKYKNYDDITRYYLTYIITEYGYKINDISCDIEKFEYILSKLFEKLDNDTIYCLGQYFHNIYAMLKLLNENKDKIDIEEYMRTLRAEFVQDEFLLVYYHAYSHSDTILKNGKQYIDKEKKFKKLIEDTCFLHNLHTPLIDCKPNSIDDENPNGIPFKLYKDSAFNH